MKGSAVFQLGIQAQPERTVVVERNVDLPVFPALQVQRFHGPGDAPDLQLRRARRAKGDLGALPILDVDELGTLGDGPIPVGEGPGAAFRGFSGAVLSFKGQHALFPAPRHFKAIAVLLCLAFKARKAPVGPALFRHVVVGKEREKAKLELKLSFRAQR